MYVERNYYRIKPGKFPELRELIKEWREEFPFPRAKARRFSHSYIAGSNSGTLLFELEFEKLEDIEAAWDEWVAMADDMTPYLERWNNILDRQTNSELWKAF